MCKKMDAKEIYKTKYIGETERSECKTTLGHRKDYENSKKRSHMLKHYLLCYKDLIISDIKFSIRIKRNYRLTSERQLGE